MQIYVKQLESENEMVPWSRDHVLTWGYMRYLMLTDLDRLNVISLDSVVMKIDASLFFKMAIWQPLFQKLA
jgi:hypothetical protein